jgi:hypothetical protein
VLVRALVLQVQPAEDETFVLRLEVLPTSAGVEDEGVSLEEAGDLLLARFAGAVGAATGEPLSLHERGTFAGLGQLGIDLIDVRLLGRDLGGNLRRHGAITGNTHGAPMTSGWNRVLRTQRTAKSSQPIR